MKIDKTNYKQTEIGGIPEEWKIETMAQICDIVTDYVANGSFASLKAHVTYNDNPDYAVLIRLADYNNNFEGDFVYVNKEGYNYLKKSRLTGGEIIISNVGEYSGTVFRAPLLELPMTLGPNSITLKTKYNDTFFYYWFKSIYGQHALNNIKSGSAVPKFNKTDFKTILAPCPPLEKQQQIASILSSLDDKIELNRKMNKTLEEIGKALFKRWFVDFEFPCLPENYKFSGARKPIDFEKVCTYKSVGGLPAPQKNMWFVYVLLCADDSFYIGITNDLYYRWYQHKTGTGAKWTKANEPQKVIHYEQFATQSAAAKREKELKTGFGRKWLKREYAKIQAGGLPARECKLTQAGKMVDSELGEIPEGWEVVTLPQVAKIQKGLSYKGKDLVGSADIALVGLKCLERGGGFRKDGIKFYKGDYKEEHKLKTGDLIVAMTDLTQAAEVLGKPALVPTIPEVITLVASLDLSIIKPITEGIDEYYLYLLLCRQESQDFLFGYSNGSTVLHLSAKGLQEFKLTKPQEGVLMNFQKLNRTVFNRLMILDRENTDLAAIRDSLLPRLMSGRLRV